MKLLDPLRQEQISSSPPSRGAWIEIGVVKAIQAYQAVAPLAGGVD